MDDFFTPGGKKLGSFPMNQQDMARLNAGGTVRLHFHTPRMLQKVMEQHNFDFGIKLKKGRIVVDDVELAVKFLALLDEISGTPVPEQDEDEIEAMGKDSA